MSRTLPRAKRTSPGKLVSLTPLGIVWAAISLSLLLRGHRRKLARADVPPILHAFKVDARRRPVRLLVCRLQRRTSSHYVQHATAFADHLAVPTRRAGMEDQRVALLDPGDRVAVTHGRRVAGRGEGDT